jgi:hypothetical protein
MTIAAIRIDSARERVPSGFDPPAPPTASAAQPSMFRLALAVLDGLVGVGSDAVRRALTGISEWLQRRDR